MNEFSIPSKHTRSEYALSGVTQIFPLHFASTDLGAIHKRGKKSKGALNVCGSDVIVTLQTRRRGDRKDASIMETSFMHDTLLLFYGMQ